MISNKDLVNDQNRPNIQLSCSTERYLHKPDSKTEVPHIQFTKREYSYSNEGIYSLMTDILNGYCFCGIFKTEEATFGMSQRNSNNFVGMQVFIIDIDHEWSIRDEEHLYNFLGEGKEDLRPAIIASSTNDKCYLCPADITITKESNGKQLSIKKFTPMRKFHLVYITPEVIYGEAKCKAYLTTLANKIDKRFGRPVCDRKCLDASHYFNGFCADKFRTLGDTTYYYDGYPKDADGNYVTEFIQTTKVDKDGNMQKVTKSKEGGVELIVTTPDEMVKVNKAELDAETKSHLSPKPSSCCYPATITIPDDDEDLAKAMAGVGTSTQRKASDGATTGDNNKIKSLFNNDLSERVRSALKNYGAKDAEAIALHFKEVGWTPLLEAKPLTDDKGYMYYANDLRCLISEGSIQDKATKMRTPKWWKDGETRRTKLGMLARKWVYIYSTYPERKHDIADDTLLSLIWFLANRCDNSVDPITVYQLCVMVYDAMQLEEKWLVAYLRAYKKNIQKRKMQKGVKIGTFTKKVKNNFLDRYYNPNLTPAENVEAIAAIDDPDKPERAKIYEYAKAKGYTEKRGLTNDEFLLLFNQEETVDRNAERMGLSRQTVSKKMRELGLGRRHKHVR